MKRKFISFILVLTAVTLLSAGIAYAGSSSQTFNNISYVDATLYINNDGQAYININYVGFSGLTCFLAETELKKKGFLGLFWTTVDIGEENNKWVDISNAFNNSFTHTFSLNSHGTYKIVTEITATGTGGNPDCVTVEHQAEY